MASGRIIKGIDAIGPLADGNVLVKRSKTPTWDVANGQHLPAPSEVQNLGPLGSGNINGRNSDLLAIAFPASVIGLEDYDPSVIFQEHMAGKGPTWENLSNGAGEYGVDSTNHMIFADTPDFKQVAIDQLNIPNAYTPDISAGAAPAADYRAAFISKYPGKQNSYPQGSTEVTHAGTTVSGDDGGLNPIESTSAGLGGWLNPTMGKWISEV